MSVCSVLHFSFEIKHDSKSVMVAGYIYRQKAKKISAQTLCTVMLHQN